MAAILPLGSDEYARTTRIAISSYPALGITEVPIGNIILKASALEMRLQKFDVSLADREVDSDKPGDPDYLLQSEYRIVEDMIFIDIRASESESGSLAASASWEGSLSIDLDVETQAVIREELAPALPATVQFSRRQTEKAAEAGEVWAVAAIAEEYALEQPLQSSDSETRRGARSEGKWILDIGGLVYIPFSDTATYAKTGYGGRIAFGYAFSGKVLSIAPRFLIGGIWLPTDTVNNTDILLIPVSLELQFATANSDVLTPYFRVGGGASWMAILPESSSVEGKIVPYTEAGLGIDI